MSCREPGPLLAVLCHFLLATFCYYRVFAHMLLAAETESTVVTMLLAAEGHFLQQSPDFVSPGILQLLQNTH